MQKIAYLFIFILFTAVSSHAQDKTNNLPNRVMYTKYYISDFFSETSKWAWEFDAVYRRQSELGEWDIWSNPLRFSIRPWIAFQYSKLSRISWNPIGIFNTAPRYPLETDLDRPMERELRSTLQFIHYSYMNRFNFTHRLRFEARLRGIDNAPDDQRFYYRFRYRMRIRTPLNTDYFYKNNTLYISKYSEIHVEWGPGYGTNFFSQSRNYIGLGYRFWDWTRLELGWVFQLNTRGNNIDMDVSTGPMFYLFMDILSRNNKRYNYSF